MAFLSCLNMAEFLGIGKNLLAAACCLVWIGCDFTHRNAERITIKGSDTEVNLVLRLAETYMERDSMVALAVTGGGSGAGIASLINGKAEIANSSRPMKPQEKEMARERGINPVPTVFAMDALAMVVHPDNGVGSLTLEEISGIYSGEITNWKELGGPDISISLYGRQSNSGTFVYFRDEVVKAEYARSVRQMNGTAQMVEAVKRDPAGVGYVGLGYVVDKNGNAVENIKILSVKTDEGDISPQKRENITEGIYPIVRPLYQYTDGIPEGRLLDFLQFEWSPEGQEIVSESGYYPIPKRLMKENRETVQQHEQ